MITADQIFAHAFGDYVLQSHWMATEKTKKNVAALAHVICYGVPFLFFQPSVAAMTVIVGTHFVIDRWRLARFVVFAKNRFAPVDEWATWRFSSSTGYHQDVPPWLSVWLLIIVDNAMHIGINALALRYL